MSKKKILIVRINAIGDVVMTTIMAQAIKAKHPDYEIHYLTSGYCTDILNPCSFIDKVHLYIDDFEKMASNLRKEKFDILYSLNYSFKNLRLALKIHPEKIIFKSLSLSNVSWVENYFLTAKKGVGDIELPESLILDNNPKDVEFIEQKIKDYPRPYVVISPGKLENQPREGRVWNIQKWLILTEKLKELYGGTVFVVGGEDEKKYHEILKTKGAITYSGDLFISESATLISKANLVISGDSGPIHIASAKNVNSLVLLGSTSPDKIKPYGKKGYYIEPLTKCKYCWKKKCKKLKGKKGYAPCMESITVDMVLDKIKQENLI